MERTSSYLDQAFSEVATANEDIDPNVSWFLLSPATSNPHASPADGSASDSECSSIPGVHTTPVNAPHVAISSVFDPEFSHGGQTPDVLLISNDLVYFYVYSGLLYGISRNGFGGLLPEACGAEISMRLSSQVLNILLHASFGLSPAQFAPSIADIGSAIMAMHDYGVSPAELVAPDSALFQIIVHYALRSPLECYALAASARLEDLAVAVSQYTLSTPLRSMTNDIADQMGPGYLRRLFFLHCGRVEAFKRLALSPPGPYPPSDDCDLASQCEISRAWSLAMAYLTWEPRPDLSVSSIEAALSPLCEKLQSNTCRRYLDERTKTLLVGWALVKKTI